MIYLGLDYYYYYSFYLKSAFSCDTLLELFDLTFFSTFLKVFAPAFRFLSFSFAGACSGGGGLDGAGGYGCDWMVWA